MITPQRFATTNLVALATTITPSSEVTPYIADNLRYNGRPQYPWKTDGLGQQTLVVELADPVTRGMIYLNATNFTAAILEWNDSDSWGTPILSTEISIGKARTYRYQYGAVLIAATAGATFFRLVIPSQATIDGAPGYRLGGLWVGEAFAPPQGFLYDFERVVMRPASVADLKDGGSRRTRTGIPWMKLTAKRKPRTDSLDPGYQDQAARWRILDEEEWNAGRLLVLLSQIDTTDTYVMQVTDDGVAEARTSLHRVETPMTLAECIGP